MAKKIVLNDKEITKLIQLYNKGNSLRELEKEFNHTRKTLSRILKENNINIRTNILNSRKYTHDETFFEKIDTEHKAYWLGFIYADGFINSRDDGSDRFGVTISYKDKKHLEKLKKSLKATNNINDYIGSGYAKDSKFSRLLITSQKTVNDLINKGCIKNKTLQLKFPTNKQVPDELIHHFIRGYIDGDGSINCSNKNWCVGIVGQYDFLIEISKIFKNNNLKFSTKDNITYQVNFSGNNQVNRILDYIYKDATIYLDRKYKKYLEFKTRKYSES